MLCANTLLPFDLWLLPDGPDVPTMAALDALEKFPQLGTNEKCGAAACFNRLARATKADVFVLLESGVLVGPGWLAHLQAAFDADPRNGLGGPSTNRCWNEQAVFPGVSSDDVARTATEAVRRFGTTRRTLQPLYSLADFCSAVRRSEERRVGEQS